MPAVAKRRRAALGITLLLFSALLVVPNLWLRFTFLPGLDADLAHLQVYTPPTRVQVLDRHGDPYDDFALERRIFLPLDEMPPVIGQAVTAAEDRRFWEHQGVDWQGILRAIRVNLEAGTVREGGSTLTQQLVKNLVVGNERSLARKLREALLAWRLESLLTKAQLLELYLNHVFLGSGAYGVEAASWEYFGHSARTLDAGEAALLAGLIPAPSRYNPRREPAQAAERRRLVLRAMVEEGHLSAEQAARLAEVPVDPPRPDSGTGQVGLAYRTAVRREVRDLFGEDLAFNLGLTVHTPYDPALQAAAERAITRAATAVEQRQGRRGPRRSLVGEDAIAAFQARAEGLGRRAGDEVAEPLPGQCFPAVALDTGGRTWGAGPFRFPLRSADGGVLLHPGLPDEGPRSARSLLHRGDVLQVCREGDEVRLAHDPWVQGAAVVLDIASGEVRALVGGLDHPLEGFNRATQARRQPGSSFKPFVYAAALQSGLSPLDRVLDAPLALPAGGGKVWSPQNAGGGFRGEVTLLDAMASSLNTVAVRLALRTGPEAVAELAQAAGVRTPLRRDLTLALGSSEVTPLDQAVGYATLARYGVHRDPVWLTRLLDARGEALAAAGEVVPLPDGTHLPALPGGPGEVVLDPGTAFELVGLLEGVVARGTGRRAFLPDRSRAGKTGTTSDYLDAWFVGFTPRTVVAVWIGSDALIPLGPGETGGRAALPAWLEIVDALGEPAERFTAPPEGLWLPRDGRLIALSRDRVPPAVLPWEPVGGAPLPRFPGTEP